MIATTRLIHRVLAITAEPHRGLHEPHGTKEELRELAERASMEIHDGGWGRSDSARPAACEAACATDRSER